MDTAQFDHLTRALAASRTRRTLSRLLAVLPIVGASGLLPGEAAARRKARRAARAEKKKKKKKPFCLNGQTIRATRKQAKKLRKQGATPGACPAITTCVPACPQGQRCCGATCITSPWTNKTVFGSQGSNASNLRSPSGVALAPDGLMVLIADSNNDRISVWTRPNASSVAWSNQTTFGSNGAGASNFVFPWGVALAPDGLTVLVTDSNNNRISVWTRPTASSDDWSSQTTFGADGTDVSNFRSPRGIALTPDGLTALIADGNNHRISVWTRPSASGATWSNQTTFGTNGAGASNLAFPSYVALTPNGFTALVADSDNHRISVWTRPSPTSAWSNQTTFGSYGSGATNFILPRGIAITPDGLTALIVDNNNSRISIWTRPGTGSTFWSNQMTFGADGDGVSNFRLPSGVAITPDGLTALITDFSNHRMSVWALTCPA